MTGKEKRHIRRKKAFLAAALCAAILFFPLFSANAEEKGLSFGDDGCITLLILSDAEEQPRVSPYYTSVMEALLKDSGADAVILLGDTADGDSFLYRNKTSGRLEECIQGITAPFEAAGIPFIPLVSGRDLASGADRETILSCFLQSAGDLRKAKDTCFCIRLGESDDPELILCFADSTFAGGIAQEDIALLRGMQESFPGVPGVLFSHDGTAAVFDALKEGDGDFLEVMVNGEEKIFYPEGKGLLLGEMNCIPSVPSEEKDIYSAVTEDTFLLVTAGEHLNAYLANKDGADLLAVPSCSYTSLSDRETRGALLLEFDREELPSYRLRFVPFASYEQFSLTDSVSYFFSTYFLCSPGVKIAGLVLIAAAAIVCLFLTDRENGSRIPEPYEDGKEEPL